MISKMEHAGADERSSLKQKLEVLQKELYAGPVKRAVRPMRKRSAV